MSSIAEAFRTGGIWMYLILLIVLSGLTLSGILTITTALKRRVPWVLWAILPVLALCLGILGQYTGLGRTFEALELATPETRMKLLAHGIALSLNVTTFGAWSAAILSTTGALGLGLGGLISAGKPRQWTPLPALMAAGLGLISIGGILAGAMKLNLELMPLLLLLLLTNVGAGVLVNLSTHPEHKARIASLRLGVGGLLVLGGASLGLGYWAMGKAQTLNALEASPPDMRLELLSAGLGLSVEGGLFVGVGFTLAALLFGVLPALTSVKEALDTRGLISGGLGALLLFTGLGAIFASATDMANHKDRVPLPRQAIELMAQTPGPKAPLQLTAPLAATTTTERCLLVWDGLEARLAPGNTALGADPCQTDAMPGFSQEGCPSKEGELKGPLCSGLNNLPTLISPQLPAQPFLERPWRSSPTQDFLVLLGGTSLSALDDPLMFMLSWQGLVGMQLELIASEQGVAPTSWIVQGTTQADELKVLTPMQAQARMLTQAQLVEELKRVAPSQRPAIVLVPALTWTMQQLVDHCAVLSNLEAQLPVDGIRPSFKCKVWSVNEHPLTGWQAARATPSASDEEPLPRLNGPLTKALIRDIIRGHQPQVRACYEAELKTNPDLEGKVIIRFEIGAQGLVTQAKLVTNSTKNERLAACLVQEALTWSFPAPDDGKPKMINYPFVFNVR